MKTVVFPGSFDPFTVGHLDILKRACNVFDRVCVGVLTNKSKKTLFTADKRVRMIKTIIDEENISNAEVEAFDGLLVDFVKKKGAIASIRGFRSVADFEAERTMAEINAMLGDGIETICFFSNPQHSCISSSAVREITAFDGDISELVPTCIQKEVMKG